MSDDVEFGSLNEHWHPTEDDEFLQGAIRRVRERLGLAGKKPIATRKSGTIEVYKHDAPGGAGHTPRADMEGSSPMPHDDTASAVPYGYCHCGCGQQTRNLTQYDPSSGRSAGEPRMFVRGHSNRRTPSGYIPVPGEDYVLIPLFSTSYRGLFAKVDRSDAERVASYRWNPKVKLHRTYATAYINGRKVQLHQFILGIFGTDGEVDHINHDGLDNRRQNLRTVTSEQNRFNHRPKRGRSSRFKGVHKSASGKWIAQIGGPGGKLYLGRFDTEEEAARAYDVAAVDRFGEHAYRNFPDA